MIERRCNPKKNLSINLTFHSIYLYIYISGTTTLKSQKEIMLYTQVFCLDVNLYKKKGHPSGFFFLVIPQNVSSSVLNGVKHHADGKLRSRQS